MPDGFNYNYPRSNKKFDDFSEQVARFWMLGLYIRQIAYIFDCPNYKVVEQVREHRENNTLSGEKPTAEEAYGKIFGEYLKVRDEHFSYFIGFETLRYPDSFADEKKRFYEVLEDRLGMKEIVDKIATFDLYLRRKILPTDGYFSENLGYFRLLDEALNLGWSEQRQGRAPSYKSSETQAKRIWDEVCLDCWENDKTLYSMAEFLEAGIDLLDRPKSMIFEWNKDVCTTFEKILQSNLKERDLQILKLRFRIPSLEDQEFKSYDEFDFSNLPEQKKSLDEVGRIYDVSRNRIRQIEKRGLKRARESGDLHKLEYIFNPFNLKEE